MNEEQYMFVEKFQMSDLAAKRPLTSIELGCGETVMEIFLEPTCPFSARAYGKLQPLVDLLGEDKIRVKLRLLSQPWHTFSSVVTRCVLAAGATAGGNEAALHVLRVVYANREAFVCEDHCKGANMALSPKDIVSRISALTDLDLTEVYQLAEVTQAIKWHTRYVRQMGVHSSPSFVVDGLVNAEMSSGQTIEEWARILGFEGY